MNINDVLKILTYVFYSLAAIDLIVSIILFFRLRIKEVIQDLNGTLTQKQIEEMRKRSGNGEHNNYGQDILEGGLNDTGSLAKTGMTGRNKAGRLGKTGFTGNASSNSKAQEMAQNLQIGSLNNQLNMGNADVGTTVLQNKREINSDFVLVKNIVYINTSEFI